MGHDRTNVYIFEFFFFSCVTATLSTVEIKRRRNWDPQRDMINDMGTVVKFAYVKVDNVYYGST